MSINHDLNNYIRYFVTLSSTSNLIMITKSTIKERIRSRRMYMKISWLVQMCSCWRRVTTASEENGADGWCRRKPSYGEWWRTWTVTRATEPCNDRWRREPKHLSTHTRHFLKILFTHCQYRITRISSSGSWCTPTSGNGQMLRGGTAKKKKGSRD